ncbi:MAG: ATP-binding protein [Thermodesulfobacteriota bacterium]
MTADLPSRTGATQKKRLFRPVVRWRMGPDDETDRRLLIDRLKFLMVFRIVFSSLLLGSTIYVQQRADLLKSHTGLIILYGIAVSVFVLSILYAAAFSYIRRVDRFALMQLIFDVSLCSLLIYCTGSFSSAFSFMYLLVIVTSGVLLFQPGSLLIALLANLQYAAMLFLEWAAVIAPPGEAMHDLGPRDFHQIIYKIAVLFAASLAVAYLSGYLAEQTRKTKQELQVMTDHVNRVKRLAVLGEMAAGLAHEIKNPLASLVGAVTMLQDHPENEAIRERLMRIITREAGRLNRLLGDFLFFARPPAATPQQIDLSIAVNEVLDLFEQAPQRSRRIRVVRHIDPSLVLNIDPSHLHQVLWNLLLNAAEAIQDEETGEIVVSASTQRQGIVLEVSDTGSGIPKERLARIFDPFFTTKTEGTGLGLSIVHRILEQYNGRIEVISHQHSGTTMKIVFPS